MADKEKQLTKGVILKLELSDEALIEYSSAIAFKTAEILNKQVNPEPACIYISGENVCKMLDISRTTLWQLDKKGITKPIWLRNVKRYRVSDIEAIGKQNK
jgi:predicted DNA-binding transcriptional regulator AlpA